MEGLLVQLQDRRNEHEESTYALSKILCTIGKQ